MLRRVPDPPATVACVAALPDDLSHSAKSRTSPVETGATEVPPVARSRSTMRAYFLLTKPRVIELLLITTVPAMILADKGIPALWLIAAVLVGGSMAAGGANTINCWIERDRDSLMRRTHGRPLPAGDINPTGALVFGLVLEVLAFALLWATSNLLAACLAVSATLFYVFVYTLWLKPRTDQNIVIGGAAGAVPVLVGWAAVTGSLAAPAWLMFAIIFFWTPPHFWALSIRYRDDYRAAGIPMLPVVRGIPAAARQIVAYSFILTVITLTLVPVSTLTWGYAVVAGVLGLAFIVQAIRLQGDPTPQRAIKLFTFSNMYLAILFAAIAVDTVVHFA
jgi:protoheme IX farnesyltransferase